jgi:hypothetical protein
VRSADRDGLAVTRDRRSGDASPGEYPAVAQVSYGAFLCTGTLIVNLLGVAANKSGQRGG